jgi:hypothetical protein
MGQEHVKGKERSTVVMKADRHVLRLKNTYKIVKNTSKTSKTRVKMLTVNKEVPNHVVELDSDRQ